MLIVYRNENERGFSRRTNLIGIFIYTRKLSRYMEEEHLKRFGDRNF